MAKAMNLVVGEVPANEKLENQHDAISSNVELTDMKNFAIVAFENPGLCHIGEEIFKNLDIQTKLDCRFVRRSWNEMFEKQALKIDLENLTKFNKCLKNRAVWSLFLKESKTKIPTFVLNSYLQDLFNRMLINESEEYENRTPLQAFASTGSSKIVNFILHMKTMSFEYQDKSRALNNAAKYGHVNVAKLLRNYSYDVLAVHTAAKHGQLEVLKVLIGDGPYQMYIDKIHHSTIMAAAGSGNVEVLKYFEEILNEDLFVEGLTKIGRLGQMILHNLAAKGNLQIFKYLCQKAPLMNPNQKYSDGCTPIHYASLYGHLEIVKFLACFTSDANAADKKGVTPIHCAAYNGHLEIVKYLALYTSNPNAASQDGTTPIHYAAESGNLEIVKFLAAHTSNPNVNDKKGKTPSKIARSKGFLDIAAYFLELETKEDTEFENPFERT